MAVCSDALMPSRGSDSQTARACRIHSQVWQQSQHHAEAQLLACAFCRPAV